MNSRSLWTVLAAPIWSESSNLRFDSFNLNLFANDDLFICGSEFIAHVKWCVCVQADSIKCNWQVRRFVKS